MLASKKTKRGVIGAVVLAGVLAVSGYAATNVLTFGDGTEPEATVAGHGSAVVEVMNVIDVDYTLDATDKTQVDTVTFTLSTGLTSIGEDTHAWLSTDDGTSFSACTDPADAAVTVVCAVPSPATGNIDLFDTDVHLVLAE